MAQTLDSVLRDNRARLFVGRRNELARFDRLLSDDEAGRVLFVHGPGGIGKTSLLQAMAARAARAGWAVARCDARLAPADPAAARVVLDQTRDTALASGERPLVLCIDTFEAWAAIESWLRDDYLPGLSTEVRVVVAGRRAPGLRWRADPGWHGVLDHLALEPLAGDEAREYLERREVAPADQIQALRIARGLPLLLALVVDAIHVALREDDAQGIESGQLAPLLIELVDHLVPPDSHSLEREALFACCLLRHTSAPPIGAMLGVDADRAEELCRWLADLSFIERNPIGLFPHDAMRAALRSTLETLPELRLRLLDAAVGWYNGRLREQEVPDALQLAEHFFLYTGFMPRIFEEGEGHEEPTYAQPARPEDAPHLRALVERNEGSEAARIFDFWWKVQPAATRVARGSEGEIRGFFTSLELHDPPREWLEADGLVARFWEARSGLARPWRDDDCALLVRMWTHDASSSGPSAVGPLWSVALVNALAANPRIALTGARHPDNEAWRSNGELYGHRELPGSRHTAGGEPTLVTIHDMSEESAIQWLEATYRRFREGMGAASGRRPLEGAWVRAALRNLHRPDRLADHPLLARMTSDDPVGELSERVRTECLALRDNGKTETLFRVLDRTYLNPAPDQRAAAEACHLSYDQYRRRLTEAIRLLTIRLERSLP